MFFITDAGFCCPAHLQQGVKALPRLVQVEPHALHTRETLYQLLVRLRLCAPKGTEQEHDSWLCVPLQQYVFAIR
jgi:hypothetical protein